MRVRKRKFNKGIIENIKEKAESISEKLGREGRRKVLEKLPIKIVLAHAVRMMNDEKLEGVFKQYDSDGNEKCINILIGLCKKKNREIPQFITEKYLNFKNNTSQQEDLDLYGERHNRTID